MACKAKNLIVLLSMAAAVGVAVPGTQRPVHAHEGATGIVKERMMAMGEVGKSMKGISAMLKDEVPYDGAEVARLSGVIHARSGDHLTKLFPAGSLDAPTEALPSIWEQWDRFDALARRLTDAAKNLEAAAADRSGARQAFAGLAKTCRACHTDFRKKKDK